MDKTNSPIRLILAVIIALGFIFALHACLFPQYIDDDADVVYIAESLIGKGKPFLGYIHGPVTFYSVKLSRLIWGATPIGGRVINLIFHMMTGMLFFLLFKKISTEKTACIGAALYYFNCYFIFNTAYACEDIYLIFCGVLTIFFFVRFIADKSRRSLYLTALSFGLGMLVKAEILLLLPGFLVFILLNDSVRRAIRLRDILVAGLIVLFVSAPYLYSLFLFPYFTEIYSRQMVSFFEPSLKFLKLFIYWPLGADWSLYRFNLGYNTVGLLLGVPCILACIRLLLTPKNDYKRLMICLVGGIIIFSFFLFSGKEVEPRHLSLLIIPLIFIVADTLSYMISRHRLSAICALCYFIAVILSAVNYACRFDEYAQLHSRIALTSWGKRNVKIDANDLSLGIVHLLKPFQPGLVVFPSDYLDSIGHYVMAHSGIPTLSPLKDDRFMWDFIRNKALDRIFVFLTPTDSAHLYASWAERNGYSFVISDNLSVPLVAEKISLPVRVLFLSNTSSKRVKDIEVILKFQDTFDPPK